MGQALYRKHRPKSLKEVVGQEHITETLKKALKQGRVSHAYLFTGPRGVGKTSIARILAHEINGLTYEDDSSHIDIIEIDAASNRRIDEIRELRDKVYVAPTSAKYKVYIIDEVHMLTREAFNALLKTLEEPPAHVVFILATTDAHKLPETIISRTQRFSFKPVEKSKVADHLAALAKQEGVKVDRPALELLAEHGEGSFRDSISLLDQASSHGEALTLESVQQLLGIPPRQSLDQLVAALADGQSSGLAQALEMMLNQGYQAASIAKQLGVLLREQYLDNKLPLNSQSALDLMAQLVEVPAAHAPDRLLEIILLKALPAQDAKIDLQVAPLETETAVRVEPESVQALEEIITEPAKEIVKASTPPTIKTQATLDAAIWPQVLAALKKRHNTLYGVVRMAQPDFNADGSVKLVFSFAFHQKRISEKANSQLLGEIIKDITGQNVVIECLLDKSSKPVALTATKPQESGELAAISNIFGGGELLES